MNQYLHQGRTVQAISVDQGFAELRFDRGGEAINKLDRLALAELREAVAAIAAAPGLRGVLVTSAKEVFIAGADITEFGALFKRPEADMLAHFRLGNDTLSALERLAVPVVAAINGYALGGGLELALCCDYRVMSEAAQAGLPEVSLGLFPGLGGTVRLPRIAGLDVAIEWIAGGKPRGADAALRAGVVDQVAAPDRLRAAALALLEHAAANEPDWRARRAARQAPVPLGIAAAREWFRLARERVAKNSPKHQPAAMMALESMEASWPLAIAAALEVEARQFTRVAKTQAAASLVQAFVSEQALKKLCRVHAREARPVKSAAVLGAGIMGGGIAFASALKGVPARMKDISQGQLDLGSGEADKLLARQVRQGRLAPDQAEAVRRGIVAQLDYAGFQQVDLVVEAVVENIDVKHAVLAELETMIAEDAIIASNTSSLRIDDLAVPLSRPHNFVGMHFFNPVPVMPLVEIVKGEKTGMAAVSAAVGYAAAMGKTPVVVKDCPGFLVNRILIANTRAFCQLVADGADFELVDRAMEDFGWPMGPAYLMDVVGMDTGSHVCKVIAAGYPERMASTWQDVLELMVGHKRLGQKTGAGFYRYEADPAGKPVKHHAADSHALIASVQPRGRRDFTDREIVERLMLPMIIEAAAALEEGVVATPAELDMALLLGIGFPRYAGGALKYADWLGMEHVLALSDKYAHLGPPYLATPGMRRMAARGARFYAD
ncbi:fatty acid oxidation complex subunit alpha FadB [Pseudoduganella namucuonensis]|uniref:enoyl-CoA hydratase n=1 Tax=Pseudoduganella namucuonensis TaxID=1035707 RepID=A0A1I7M0H6_9BURK|nr:3-hydroxyacyl-CoA dehydrogenase / enoyl-CoA hydratase / 3-hydroxybutyryl-CoA epimerase / enoyl-CoA isomerase [Pseudoduganella namucuonensis]